MSVEISKLSAHGAAARVALAKMDEFIGRSKTDEEYRNVVIGMIKTRSFPTDIVGAVLIGVEHAADILRNEMRLVGEGD
jgi:hypothetical protein